MDGKTTSLCTGADAAFTFTLLADRLIDPVLGFGKDGRLFSLSIPDGGLKPDVNDGKSSCGVTGRVMLCDDAVDGVRTISALTDVRAAIRISWPFDDRRSGILRLKELVEAEPPLLLLVLDRRLGVGAILCAHAVGGKDVILCNREDGPPFSAILPRPLYVLLAKSASSSG